MDLLESCSTAAFAVQKSACVKIKTNSEDTG